MEYPLRIAGWVLNVVSTGTQSCGTALLVASKDNTISMAGQAVGACIQDLWSMIFKLSGITLVLVSIAAIPVYLIVISISKILTPVYSYEGKHVLVTGGSSGIGLAVAEEYLRRGARVTIVARDRKKLKEAEEYLAEVSESLSAAEGNIERNGPRILSISCDVACSEETVVQAFEPALRAFGPVDVLVNCAGSSVAGAFDELQSSEFERMLRINVLGSVYPTRAVLPGMKRIGGGRIVFVASQVAQVAIHGYSAYGASKWALRGMAEALQMEVKPFGILVSVCYPPDTDTPGYKAEMETKPSLTKQLSESGSVFKAENVAKDIVKLSGQGYFGISTGLDGWLLKQLHPGMTPINNVWEVVQQILFSPLARCISVFYLLAWDALCFKHKRELDTTIASISANQANRKSPRHTTSDSKKKK